MRTAVDERGPMRGLLRHGAAGGSASSYTRRLPSAFDERAQPASTPAQAGAAEVAEPLTGQNVEILRLMGTAWALEIILLPFRPDLNVFQFGLPIRGGPPLDHP